MEFTRLECINNRLGNKLRRLCNFTQPRIDGHVCRNRPGMNTDHVSVLFPEDVAQTLSDRDDTLPMAKSYKPIPSRRIIYLVI